MQEHHTAEFNYFHTRYIMAIDPTDNETAIWLLFALGICDRGKTQICYSADFASDVSEISQCEVILKVKNAMESGDTVVMINSQAINSCFYDVFNCYFDVITGTDGKYPLYIYVAFFCFFSPLFPFVFLFSLIKYASEVRQSCSWFPLSPVQSAREF